MPRVFEAIGRGIAGAGRAIRGGAAQVTPVPAGGAQPMDEVPRPNADDTPPAKRSLMQRFGAKIKRDAANAPATRLVKAIRNRRKAPARGSR